jgi:Phosphotransferase enzyme family
MQKPPHRSDHGVAAWSTTSWRESAVAWIDSELAGAGRERTGEVEQASLRPWATVQRVPTADGPVWFKATGPGTRFEVGLYELLARTVPERVLTPLGADPARGWIILPDGGPSLGERKSGAELVDALVPALVEYGRLQRELEPHVDELLSLGVADMRLAAMPERFDQALQAAAGRPIERRLGAMAGTVAAWCERLAASPVRTSLDHNDLHPWNILVAEGTSAVRYYDWGDSVVAHPFAAMLVPLGFVQRGVDAELDDPRFLLARDAYLEVFTDVAPLEELIETLELACRVAKIARALTWERALQAARTQGEAVDERFEDAPLRTLESLLDDSYLGGA